uniref:Uncharacterized protein n=1 Tax=Skeletonema marinoi TaxID=267567 RepID=A0A7S2KTG2_9STRA|mmetsp:Transcript_16493/g.27886  ORF Transcript_16493/g.27886 Transcript_16493/m.27886 type:complete len:213 (+) Transcript_16493:59-697(+)
MMRLTTFLVALLCGTTAAYTVLPQRSSHFVGHGVYHTSATASTTSSSATIEMKKGKPNVSPNMRSQYARAQEMESYRQSMMDSQRMGADGFPVFNLYVRTSLKNMWYPCGSFKGDEKSAALCQNYADNGLLSSISKNQLDSGVGGSLYRDLARLEETIVRGYPQLRKEKGNLEFGYKLSFGGLSKEQEKIQVVDVKEQKGFFDGLKNVFGGN